MTYLRIHCLLRYWKCRNKTYCTWIIDITYFIIAPLQRKFDESENSNDSDCVYSMKFQLFIVVLQMVIFRCWIFGVRQQEIFNTYANEKQFIYFKAMSSSSLCQCHCCKYKTHNKNSNNLEINDGPWPLLSLKSIIERDEIPL